MAAARLKKYFLKPLAWLLGILLVLYLVLYIYISSNKQKIIQQITSQINKKIKGTVTIGNADLSFFGNFPIIGVSLENVKVTDSMYSNHGKLFFEAKEVFAGLALGKLLKKEPSLRTIRIRKGNIYAYTDSAGYSNTYLLAPRDDKHGQQNESQPLSIRNVKLEDVHITIDDRRKQKLYDLLVNELEVMPEEEDNGRLSFQTIADINIGKIAFNLSKGIFLENKKFSGKVKFEYDSKQQQLNFHEAKIRIASQPFEVDGRFEFSGDAPQFDLSLKTDRIRYDFVRGLLPARISTTLSQVQVSNELDAYARITGPLKGGEPLVVVKWKTKNTDLKTPFMDFNNASFTGLYTNEVVQGLPRRDPNSMIVITAMNATWHGLPIQTDSINIMNLEDPLLSCDLHSEFPLDSINDEAAIRSLKFLEGKGIADLSYKGPIEKNDETNSFLNGTITLINGRVLYTPRNVTLQQVNGKMSFSNSDLIVESLQANVLNNKVMMRGQAKKLISLMGTDPAHVNMDWVISCPTLNLDAFAFLLGSRNSVTKTNKQSQKMTQLTSHIDDVLEKGTLHVLLNAGQLSYKKFTAANVSADVSLLPDKYLVNKVIMDHADGKISFDGTLATWKPDYVQADINAEITNVDVKKLFTAFDNFGQTGITANSIEGKLSSTVHASMALNDSGKVYPASMVSTVSFSLKDGALVNYEPVKKMQRSIFKKRDFENIRFAELKNTLEIKDREITINRMEIQSTVISMFVEGIYSQKGNTDISIQVPLNNIRKRDSTYIPENIGVDKKGGRSIFLRGRPGPDGNIKFALDLFKKFSKKQKK